MWPPVVVPLHPVSNDPPRLLKRLERVLPDTLFFEAAKEPLDHAVLLRRVGRDEFLLYSIVSTGLSKPTALEDQAVVTAQDWGSRRSERPEPLETRGFDGPFRLLRATPQGKLIADALAIVTINHRREMRPAVLATGDMRHVHRPPFITATRPTCPASHARAWGRDALMHEPPLLLQHTVDRLAIDDDPVLKPHQCPEPPIAKRRMLLNPIPHPFQPRRIDTGAVWCWAGGPMQARPAYLQHPTTSSR